MGADAKAALEVAEAKYQAEFEAEFAAEDAAKAEAPAPSPGAAPNAQQHIGPDCKPLRDKVDGPKEHVLCKTHGHVYNEKTG